VPKGFQFIFQSLGVRTGQLFKIVYVRTYSTNFATTKLLNEIVISCLR